MVWCGMKNTTNQGYFLTFSFLKLYKIMKLLKTIQISVAPSQSVVQNSMKQLAFNQQVICIPLQNL